MYVYLHITIYLTFLSAACTLSPEAEVEEKLLTDNSDTDTHTPVYEPTTSSKQDAPQNTHENNTTSCCECFL